jgi:deoxyribodipyrimidine photo-lyase
MLKQRIRKLNQKSIVPGPIIYWMSRDQRLQDNWALVAAQSAAIELKQPLIIVFCLTDYPQATEKHYKFMMAGLAELAGVAKALAIPFVLLKGDVISQLTGFIEQYKIGGVFTDFSPLKTGRQWRDAVASLASIAVYEVDAHNIVPAWVASPKQEFAARTIRPKLFRLMSEFVDEFPALKLHPYQWLLAESNAQLLASSHKALAASGNSNLGSGVKSANQKLVSFLVKSTHYSEQRNDPTLDAQSGLSPFLHFGQISSQRILMLAGKQGLTTESAFVEELFIRKELADNYCLYNPNYDNFAGFPLWAQKTLNDHRSDEREHTYSSDMFEQAKTHDPIWNAAQQEMVKTGKMHGYMRMYWAKKILEWTATPEQAQEIAIYLNDKYELDGRDPNGYTGIAWSIGGLHDRPWFDRKVFGTVRYMNSSGLERKFDTRAYIAKVNAI